MKKINKVLFFALAIVYIIVAPIIIYRIISMFMFNSFLSFPLTCLFLVFVVLNTLTVMKLMIDIDKYGSPFRKIRRYSDNELIIAEINALKTYQKTLIINNNLIVVNESGVFEFATINKNGILKGDINDLEWTINDKIVNNPFIVKDDIYHYFILKSGIVFKVTGVWLTTRQFIYNTLEKRLNERIYTKEKIDQIYNDLKVKYGNNEN